MSHEISFEMKEELVKHAVNRFWLRRSGWRDGIGIVLLAAGALMLYETDERGLLVTVFATISAFFVAILPIAYFVYRHRIVSRNRRAPDRHVVFRFDDDGVYTQSSLGYSHLKWPLITRIWRFSRVWLLFFSSDGYLLVPTSLLEPEMSGFIIEKVKSHGGKIR